ncbi:MAG: site-specific DNA-methyltransferase [Acidobacteria bacterium]|nr:site-specific DNA-methyltransferase [Acidobacteriota bacterium]MCA1641969.1 site-specific DNA-methyltransferase [Acidobacteriota bacterium]
MTHKIIQADATTSINLETLGSEIDLTFLDPPFNQGKDYALHEDNLPDEDYWAMMRGVCADLLSVTSAGGALYFMQREKNTERVLQTLRETGWTFQNLIIWKKKTSAVPGLHRYGKQYQIIAFATKGKRPRAFHRLRIDPPLLPGYRHEREKGIFLTDVWDDIRELTAGYFAGDEALRGADGARFHKQQAPLALLVRIILSSTKVGDTVFDPFAGTGTTAVAAVQLNRKAIALEIAPENAACIGRRLSEIRDADDIQNCYDDYFCTDDLASIWGSTVRCEKKQGGKEHTLLSLLAN